jgi:hypothetical protein
MWNFDILYSATIWRIENIWWWPYRAETCCEEERWLIISCIGDGNILYEINETINLSIRHFTLGTMRLNSVMSLVDIFHGYSEVESISFLLEIEINFGTFHINNVFCNLLQMPWIMENLWNPWFLLLYFNSLSSLQRLAIWVIVVFSPWRCNWIFLTWHLSSKQLSALSWNYLLWDKCDHTHKEAT